MARLDSADLQPQARAVEAQLVSARADAVNAQNDFLRYQRLVKGGWTTQQEYDRRKAVKETSEARVRQLEAQLRVALNNSQYATPCRRRTWSGDGGLGRARPGGRPRPNSVQDRPAGRSRCGCRRARVDGGALDKAQLSAELWSMPGVVIAGRLRDIAPMADAATRTYRARVTLIDPPPRSSSA